MNSVINGARETAEHVADAVGETGGSMKLSLIDLGTQVLRLFNQARVAEMRGVDGVLHHIGLQRRSSALGPALWFAAGAVVAGGAAIMLAPTSGRALRRKLASLLAGPEHGPEKTPEKSDGVPGVVRDGKHDGHAHSS